MNIKEFKDCEESIQDQLCNMLWHRWEKEYINFDLQSVEELKYHLSEEIYKCFVFLEDSDIIGTVSSNTDTGREINFKTNFFICNLFVSEDKRKKGYGKTLLNYIEKFLVSQNVSNVTLYCESDVYDFYVKNKYSDFGKCPTNSALTCMMKFLK
jgi:GNAT superfamily N-acetyltransferase